MTLYEALDIPADSSFEQVKKAWRVFARKHHPDKGGQREDFERGQHAWLVLRDPNLRAEYDRTGKDPGNTVDNEQAQLIANISRLLAVHISQPGALHKDLIACIRADLAAEDAQDQRTLTEIADGIKQLQKIQKKFNRKKAKPGPNLVDLAMQGHLNVLEQAKAAPTANIEFREKLRLVLEDFEFLPETRNDMYMGMGLGAQNAQNPYLNQMNAQNTRGGSFW